MDKNIRITVCDNCFLATCWQGKFMCDEAIESGTIDLPIWVLEKLDLEHPDHWKRIEEMR